MSNRAITWAYGQPIKSAGAKFVLVTLADMADEKNSCYPGQDLLADRTGQTSRTVRRQLVELEQAGFIQRSARRREGVRTSDRYVLSVDVQQGQNGLPDIMSGSSESPDIHDTQPDIHDRVTGQDVRVTQREPSEEPSGSETKRKRKPKTYVPDIFPVTPEMSQWAETSGVTVNLNYETQQWQDYHRTHSTQAADWAASWRTWMRNTAKWAKPTAGPAAPRQQAEGMPW